ncbi:MAG: leucine-rich repeat domain-containing protein [Janthinobacterium lividum]
MLNLKIVFTALTLLSLNISTYASDIDILENEQTANISNKQPRILDTPNELIKLPRDILMTQIIPYCNENIIKLNRFFFTLVTGFPYEQIFAKGVGNKPTKKPLSLSIQKTLNFNKLNFEFFETIPSFVWHSLITRVVNLPPQYWTCLEKTNIHKFSYGSEDYIFPRYEANIMELVESIENSPIRSLVLQQKKLNSKDIEALTRLFNLTSLQLISSNNEKNIIEARDLNYIAQMTNLQDLRLHLNEVNYPDSIGLQQLTSLTRLRNLDLSYSVLKNESLQDLSLLKDLNHLNLYNSTFNDKGLQNLILLKNLTYLNLGYTEASKAVYPYLAQLTNLTHLDMNCMEDMNILEVIGVSYLTYLTNLTHLDLGETTVKDIEALNFSHLTNLTYLNMYYIYKNKVLTLNLMPLINLTYLNVDGLKREYQGTIDLARLTKLTYLNISKNDIGNATSLLTSLINLTHFNAKNNSIRDIDVLELARLPNLTYLDVSHNDMSNTVVEYLRQLNRINIPVKGMRIDSWTS